MSRPIIDVTHDPRLRCWISSAVDHPQFPVQNLPLGIFAPKGEDARIGVAIGDMILDLRALARTRAIDDTGWPALEADTLNALLARPGSERRALRHALSSLLTDPSQASKVEPCLHVAGDCQVLLPAAIGDYTDFYVGIEHAQNIGRLLRPDNPLLPNYKHIPIGYHGRASSVRPSGTSVARPKGQRRPAGAEEPTFGPSERLDFELELGVWIGPPVGLGDTVEIARARDHIAGFCLLNDWSARDLQAWEYQPLGPFLSKNFMTSISPWVVTIEAMAPFFTTHRPRPAGDPTPLPYLMDEDDQAFGGLSVALEVALSSAAMRAQDYAPVVLSRASAADMYWTVAQMVTHHASSGCDLNPGDLLGTGTISSPDRSGYGSLMELSRGGAEPLEIPGGARAYLEDGDEVILSAVARKEGYASIGFGECRGIVAAPR